MIREYRTLEAFVKILLRYLRSAHVAALGMLGSVTVHFKNH
jgi:hypothetical protein